MRPNVYVKRRSLFTYTSEHHVFDRVIEVQSKRFPIIYIIVYNSNLTINIVENIFYTIISIS